MMNLKSNKSKSKSIKGDMIRRFGALIVVITLVFSGIFYLQAEKSNIDNTMNMMNTMSTQAANLVESKLNTQITDDQLKQILQSIQQFCHPAFLQYVVPEDRIVTF